MFFLCDLKNTTIGLCSRGEWSFPLRDLYISISINKRNLHGISKNRAQSIFKQLILKTPKTYLNYSFRGSVPVPVSVSLRLHAIKD